MTYEQNVRAILDCHFSCVREELIDNAVKCIVDLKCEQEPKMGYCKECKYFEYDNMAMVDGIPIIVAHEICSKWGGGCKTREDGYCFMFEPQESEDKE